jgi:diguanylate cyclase (GGDEF)-like protein
VRKTDKAARYGGDEFVIILPHTEKAGARTLAVKLQQALRSQLFYSNKGDVLKVTGSFGVATFPEDAASCKELIGSADKAMYRVKEMSRDGVLAAGDEHTAPGNAA